MHVLTGTDKHEGVIIKISPTIGYQENGNPLVDNDTMAIAAILVGEVSGDIDIPEGVGEYTHTWMDGVFAENPNYEPPPASLPYADMVAALRELGLIAPDEEVTES